ncbi:MAG: dethiobiotin synthase [Nannocystaceae bacterium]
MGRLYVLGTDTDVGKTQVACEILRLARRRGHTVLPFKPALSGYRPGGNDSTALLHAAGMSPDHAAAITPFRYATPIAPGLAEDAEHFTTNRPPSTTPLRRAEARLLALERTLAPALTLLEGAGGIWVPMPGGTWQPEWVRRLSPTCVLVARPGLGTINHTVLSLRALMDAGLHPVGFVLCATTVRAHAQRDTCRVLEQHTALPYLGTLAYRRVSTRTSPSSQSTSLTECDGHDWLDARFWDALELGTRAGHGLFPDAKSFKNRVEDVDSDGTELVPPDDLG